MNKPVLCLFASLLGWSAAAAQDAAPFQGKAISMIVGSAPGGGTDAYGRLVASFLGNYLPGAPSIIVRNVPGADGITAMNYMVDQAAPDGTTITAAANTTADPLHYRKPQSHFDPSIFGIIGGAGRGGEILIVNKAVEARLYDRQLAPVVMGSLGAVPRSGMQITAWGVAFLGWNAKWVVGYRSTNELFLALERGEVDMTSTGNLFQILKLTETGRFRILVQSGSLRNGAIVPRPDFGDAPIFAGLLEGKINDPVARQALEYWADSALMDKWLALPPKAPIAMLDVYRDAYGRMIQDRQFLERAKTISDDFSPLSSSEVDTLLKRLASLPPQAIEYTTLMLRKQGLEVQ